MPQIRLHKGMALGLGLLLAVGCGGGSDPTTTPTTNNPGTTGGTTTGGTTTGGTTTGGTTTGGTTTGGNTDTATTNAITVPTTDNVFTPALTKVAVGTTVHWQWDSGSYGTAHTLVFDDGTPGLTATTTGSFDRTFNSAGVYTYQCIIHPGMTGTIVVK